MSRCFGLVVVAAERRVVVANGVDRDEQDVPVAALELSADRQRRAGRRRRSRAARSRGRRSSDRCRRRAGRARRDGSRLSNGAQSFSPSSEPKPSRSRSFAVRTSSISLLERGRRGDRDVLRLEVGAPASTASATDQHERGRRRSRARHARARRARAARGEPRAEAHAERDRDRGDRRAASAAPSGSAAATNQHAASTPPTSAASATPAARQRPSGFARAEHRRERARADARREREQPVAAGRASATATSAIAAITMPRQLRLLDTATIAHTAPRWTSSADDAERRERSPTARGTPGRTPSTGGRGREPAAPRAARRIERCARTAARPIITPRAPTTSTSHSHSESVAVERGEPQLARELDRPRVRPQREHVLDRRERERAAGGHRDRAADVGDRGRRDVACQASRGSPTAPVVSNSIDPVVSRSWHVPDVPRSASSPARLARRDRRRVPLRVSVFPADPERERAAARLPRQGDRRRPHVRDRSRRRALGRHRRRLAVRTATSTRTRRRAASLLVVPVYAAVRAVAGEPSLAVDDVALPRRRRA